MFSGGPLFDYAEKFGELYISRTKDAKVYALADIAIRGVSFLNLQWIVYNKLTDEWHSPRLQRTIERTIIQEIVDKVFTLSSLFEEFRGTRYLVQSVDLVESMDPESVLSGADSHVVVITKVEGKWWLLDVCEKKPICMDD